MAAPSYRRRLARNASEARELADEAGRTYGHLVVGLSSTAGIAEALAARAFQELSRLLESSASASTVRATVTVQTPQGLELCWINDLEPGRKLLHGEDE